jgi:hypothetical protein
MTDVERFPQDRRYGESRRSTRVPLKIVFEAQGVTGHLICKGETIVVNLHGALISTSVALTMKMKIEIYVHLTGTRLRPGDVDNRWGTAAQRSRVAHSTQARTL